MTTGTWADPHVVDMAADTGSVVIDTTPATGYAIAGYSADTSQVYFPVSAIIDNSTSTCWETTGVSDTWIALKDNAGPTVLTTYQLRERDGWTGRAPTSWTIEGSDDEGGTWTVVDTQSGFTGWDGTYKSFTLAAPATYEWFRIKVTATVGGDIVNLAEFRFNNVVPSFSANCFFRIINAPERRIYTIVTTNGTGVLNDSSYEAWKVYAEIYGEPTPPTNYGDYVGYRDRFTAEARIFYAPGEANTGLITRLIMTGHGTLTWAWTSIDWVDRPYTWFDPDELALPSGSVSYDALNGGSASTANIRYGRRRHYVLNPTGTDPITITTNEPDAYYEVYRETGVDTYDEYVEDGFNLSDGTPDTANGGLLAFIPEAGETYHLVVYPEGVPDYTTTYTLEWDQSPLPPPPYYVTNDDFLDAFDLGVLATSTQVYDNTGATEDSTALPGKRSIWYKFTVDEAVAVKLKAVPSTTGDDRRPSLRLWTSTGTSIQSASQLLSRYLDPGQTYFLQIHFANSGPFSLWEDAGSLQMTVVPRPIDTYINDRYELVPGDDSAGGGQNAKFGPVIMEGTFSAVGESRFWKIVVPYDGGMSMIVEKTTTFTAQVLVKLPYEYDGGNRSMVRVQLDSGLSSGPRKLPMRQVGATDVEPLTIAVKAGQVIEIDAAFYTGDAFFRWGMTTAGTMETDWIDPAYGKVLTRDGTLTPSGWTTTQRDEVTANVVGWKNDDYGSAYAPYTLGTKPGDTNPPVTSFSGGNSVTIAPSAPLHWEAMFEHLTSNIDGTSPSAARATDTSYTNAIQNNLDGYIMSDVTGVIQNLTSSLRLVRHQGYVAHDGQTEWKENGPNVWHPRSEIETAARKTINDHGPIIARASYGFFNSIRAWSSANEADTIVGILRYRVEWDAEPVERYDTYRWFAGYSAWRQTRAPYDPLDGYPGTAILTPDPAVIKTYDVPLELSQQAWLTPDEIEADGELIETLNLPSESGGALTSATVRKERDYPVYGTLPWAEDALVENIIGGAHPAIGTKFFDSTYALVTSVYGDGTWDFDALMAHHFADHGWSNDDSGAFVHSAFIWYEIGAEVRTEVRRVYESNYRVSKWTPSLAAFTYTPPLTPLPATDTSSETGEYIYEGDAGTGVTGPILWFLYKKWGFLGDSIVVYGQGLGNTQGELHGVLKMGAGTTYPIIGDVAPGVVDWELNAASDHAYDGTGVIYEGTAVAPPRVDAEVQTIEFVVPTGLSLTDPTEFHVYVTNDNGTSNALTLMLYPMVDLDMQSAEPLLVTSASAMGVFEQDEPEMMMMMGGPLTGTPSEKETEQRYSRASTDYVITGPYPERAPQLLTDAAADFALTVGAPTSGLDDPVSVALPLLLRYRPLETKIEPRPDLGTGTSAWNSNEGSTMDWKFQVASAPFVDDTTTIASRNGEIERPAMVFPGDAWMETTNGFAVGPRLTFAMAATIYPDAQPRSYLLSSFISGTPDPDTFPLEMYVEGDLVSLHVGTRIMSFKIAPGYLGRRPVIIVLSIEPKFVRWAVVSDGARIREVQHLPLNVAGLKLYLGRSNDAGNLRMATMDVFDVGLDITWTGIERFWSVINRLDSIYGVMK